MVNFKEIYHFFQGSRGGPTFSRGGGPTFSRGGSNCLFPIETHKTCDYPGGGGPDPLSPLWIRTCNVSVYRLCTCTSENTNVDQHWKAVEMEISNFIFHSSTCSVDFEYLIRYCFSFAYDFILNGMGLDNDFPNSESSTSGGLRTENLVLTLVVLSQPERMCIAESTIHTSGLIQRDILCRFKHP